MRRITPKQAAFSGLLCSILLAAALFTGPNFHEVTPGVLYRSRQLSGKQFDRYIRRYGIKTVINLRGASAGERWYADEMAAAAGRGAVHHDIALSATRYVPPARLDSIMRVAAACARPILVHCKGGADRTGLFCAAWKFRMEKLPREKAAGQLTFWYGHVPLFHKNTWAMDSSYNDYARFLDSTLNR